MTARRLLFVWGVALAVGACVEKDPDIPAKGRRPLTQAEKARAQKDILKAPPQKLRFAVNADLEGKLVYLGMDAASDVVVPGKPFNVVHYWQVKKPVRGWKLFVHTNGPKLSDFRNFDHIPVHGLHPVTKWEPGTIVRDRHAIVLPKNTRYKTVDIYVGIWRGGQRLKVKSGKSDGKNRVLAAQIPVGRSAKRRPPPTRPRYVVRRARGPIKIDGKADEPSWKSAPTTGHFVSSLEGKPLMPRTKAKLLWDERNLYVFFTAEDEDVWAQVKKPDDLKMWTEQVFEIFLDADGNGATYIELQVNPRGVVFDAYLPRPGQVQTDWTSGVRAKVVVHGTLDKRDDKDKGWQAELAIPLSSVQGRSKASLALPPKPGHKWRMNLFRTDRPAKGALKAWAWSPTRRSTFHDLSRFGDLVFADSEGRIQPKPDPKKSATLTKTAPRPMGGIK